MSNYSTKIDKKRVLKEPIKLLSDPLLILYLYKRQIELKDLNLEKLKSIKQLGKAALNESVFGIEKDKITEITFIPTLYPKMRESYLKSREKTPDNNK